MELLSSFGSKGTTDLEVIVTNNAGKHVTLNQLFLDSFASATVTGSDKYHQQGAEKSSSASLQSASPSPRSDSSKERCKLQNKERHKLQNKDTWEPARLYAADGVRTGPLIPRGRTPLSQGAAVSPVCCLSVMVGTRTTVTGWPGPVVKVTREF